MLRLCALSLVFSVRIFALWHYDAVNNRFNCDFSRKHLLAVFLLSQVDAYLAQQAKAHSAWATNLVLEHLSLRGKEHLDAIEVFVCFRMRVK